MPPRSATLLDVDVSRQGESHTCCKCCAYLACFCLYFAPYYCEARSSSAIALHLSLSVCLSVSLSGWLPFSCVPRLPSQLCVLCCPAARARTPVWHLPAELGVIAGGARRPTAWQESSLPLLSSRTVVYFRSCCSKLCFSPNAGQTMRPRSLPVLEPDIGLNLPQATHFPPTHILFRIFSSLFSAGLAICSSALAL